MNYRDVFNHLRKKDCKGIVGMEHNISPGRKEGVDRLIRADAECDIF